MSIKGEQGGGALGEERVMEEGDSFIIQGIYAQVP